MVKMRKRFSSRKSGRPPADDAMAKSTWRMRKPCLRLRRCRQSAVDRQRPSRVIAKHPEVPAEDVAFHLRSLAKVYIIKGRYSEAYSHLTRVLQIREKASSPDYGLIAITLGDLGQLEERRGNFAEAEKHFIRAID